MKLTLRAALAISVAAFPLLAGAAEPAQPVGTETRAWVQLQTSGTAASAVERPIPGEIADRQFQRYSDSFSRPIPENFSRDSFVSDSGGSK